MSRNRKQLKAQRLASFEALVSEYEAALLRYAARILYDYNAAQDVVQNTFVKLYRNWEGELCPSPKLSGWLYRVTHNGAIDHMRKESRRGILHKKHAAEACKFIPPDRGKGFRISENAERAAMVLQMLDIREQQLVVLKVYEEKSYQEISDITGLTTSNVGYILHHAMKKMAKEMKKAEPNE